MPSLPTPYRGTWKYKEQGGDPNVVWSVSSTESIINT